MKPIKTLHRGFDKLEISIKGALDPEDIDVLELARQEAEKSYSPTLVSIGPGSVDMHVAESGLKGGYAFRCDTGPMGELWFFKRGLSRDDWNIRVSVKALALATEGWRRVYKRLINTLEDLGVKAPEMRVARVDYAIDYQMPLEFVLDPGCFVSHSRATRSEHAVGPRPVETENPFGLHTHWAGRKPTSVTIGKMPGQQVIVYDKRREVIAKKNNDWFIIWDVDPHDKGLAVFRVELRAGKRHLKSWNAREFQVLEKRLGTIFGKMITSVRYVVPTDAEKNVSRWPLSRLWKSVAQDVNEGLAESFDGSSRGRVIMGRREQIYEQRRQFIMDVVPGTLIAKNPSVDAAMAGAGDFLRDLAKTYEKTDKDKLRKKFQKAKDKLHFI